MRQTGIKLLQVCRRVRTDMIHVVCVPPPRPPPPPPPPRRPKAGISLLQWNVERNYELAGIIEELKRIDADLISLQVSGNEDSAVRGVPPRIQAHRLRSPAWGAALRRRWMWGASAAAASTRE